MRLRVFAAAFQLATRDASSSSSISLHDGYPVVPEVQNDVAPAEEVRAERAVDVRREAEVRRVAAQVRQRAHVVKRRASELEPREAPER